MSARARRAIPGDLPREVLQCVPSGGANLLRRRGPIRQYFYRGSLIVLCIMQSTAAGKNLFCH